MNEDEALKFKSKTEGCILIFTSEELELGIEIVVVSEYSFVCFSNHANSQAGRSLDSSLWRIFVRFFNTTKATSRQSHQRKFTLIHIFRVHVCIAIFKQTHHSIK